MSIEQRVKEIAAEVFGDDLQISNESTFESLGADSLDVVEFAMALEDEFEIAIDNDVIENLDTIQGFVDLVTNLSEPDH